MINYYDLLGVPTSATLAEIRLAYRSCIQAYHPDVNKAQNANQLTALLIEAWETLSSDDRRAAYDVQIAHSNNGNSGSSKPERHNEAQHASNPNESAADRKKREAGVRKAAQRERERLFWEEEARKEQAWLNAGKNARKRTREEKMRAFWQEEQRKEDELLAKERERREYRGR